MEAGRNPVRRTVGLPFPHHRCGRKGGEKTVVERAFRSRVEDAHRVYARQRSMARS